VLGGLERGSRLRSGISWKIQKKRSSGPGSGRRPFVTENFLNIAAERKQRTVWLNGLHLLWLPLELHTSSVVGFFFIQCAGAQADRGADGRDGDFLA
jgi:hypothetical protein